MPHIVVALSGGPDSCALLLALCEAADANLVPRPVGAAHFHHGLRGADADADAAFAAALCARLGVPCVVGLGNARPAPGQSPHDAARKARYVFFEEAAGDLGANLVATAHTKDDQAETVLMRVLRGTGVDGLAGIPPRRDLRPGLAVVRPLLSHTRADVEAYCRARGVEARRDPSNENARYTRARVRAVLPALAADFNARLPDALARLAANAAGDAALLNQIANDLWSRVLGAGGAEPGYVHLRLAPLQNAPAPLRCRVLLRALALAAAQLDGDDDMTAPHENAENAVSFVSLEIIERTLTAEGADHWRADLPGGLYVLRHNYTGADHSFTITSHTYSDRLAKEEAETAAPVPTNGDYHLPLVVDGAPVQLTGSNGAFVRVTVSAAWRELNDEPVERRRNANRVEIAADSWAENGTETREPDGTMAAKWDDALTSPRLVVRPARVGERFAPLGMNGKTRLVRDALADAHIHASDRAAYPVVALENDDGSDGEILWIIGVAQAERTRITDATRRIIRLQVH